ncbi:cytochrome c oxidase assembly factor 3, mitochondrial isoform X1 [Eurytemora carolleeae]|uniref:cytochrome c oxidase assembly factor 3, mitochondrial isoform X1 n=1 Tax=Eurytemora carolleeae TaxID=1294199 RepID=UPI000C7924AE|nr:cytochrome c oxidase assembly factor 3, mitochondrial isoform X1 [Eurytemora carolleeae]|eukprot:XP_023326629.1 cytochrome c oxidase assembly factor 3, mitochondrial-like isoform X1 [Eurytemora affinis]
MAARMCNFLQLTAKTARPAIRNISSTSCLMIQRTQPKMKIETMKQVDVDSADIQKKLGNINMDFVRKAEKKNKERAKMHRFFRRTDWMIAAFCFSLVIGIYSYTMFAIQQEKFLDDFDMPEDIDRTEKTK